MDIDIRNITREHALSKAVFYAMSSAPDNNYTQLSLAWSSIAALLDPEDKEPAKQIVDNCGDTWSYDPSIGRYSSPGQPPLTREQIERAWGIRAERG